MFVMQTSAMKTCFQIAECSFSYAKKMQTSAMKTCFQIAECSFSYAKLSNISVTSKYLNEINIIIGKRQGSICHDEKVAYRPLIIW